MAEYLVQILVEYLRPGLQQNMGPRSVHCICCFLTNRLLTTWLIVDSTKAVLIGTEVFLFAFTCDAQGEPQIPIRAQVRQPR